MAIPLVPNVINADVFDVQADARDGRFTWKRVNGKLVPGLIILGKPSLRFSPVGQDIGTEINQAASMDDVSAWAFAARWWISFAWQQYADASEAWQQLDWARSVAPDSLPPTGKSLIPGAQLTTGGLSFGLLEVFGDSPPWLLTGSWTQYFASLVAQVVAQTVQHNVNTLIEIQIAMRSVAMMMQSILSAGPEVQRAYVDTCDIARAWRSTPTVDCQIAAEIKIWNDATNAFGINPPTTQAEFLKINAAYMAIFNRLLALYKGGTVTGSDARKTAGKFLGYALKYTNNVTAGLSMDGLSAPLPTGPFAD